MKVKTLFAAMAATGAMCTLALALEPADVLPPLVPVPIIEDPTAKISVDYDSFIGGFSIAKMRIDAAWDDTSYSLSSRMWTQGIADNFFPAQFHNTAQGTFEGNRIAPSVYSTNYRASDDKRQVRITFDGVQPISVEAEPVYEMEAPLSPLDKRNSLDPMSSYLSFLTGMTATEDNPCGTKVPIFDGRQRYNLNIKFVKEMKITDDIVDSYSGPGYHCKMQYEQIAGFKRNSRKDGRLPFVDVYLAKLDDGKYRVPLRMNIGTEYGFAVLRVTRLDVDIPMSEKDTAQADDVTRQTRFD